MCSRCTQAKLRAAMVVVMAPAFLATQPLAMMTLTAALPTPWAAQSPASSSLLSSEAHAKEAKASNARPEAKVTKWTCPMHPHYIADAFGTCPICGMDLVKLETGNASLGPEAAETRSIVTIQPEVMQNMGVRLGKVERTQFGRTVRSFGIVLENARLQTEVTARFEGWIEKLHVTAVGDQVKRGMKLFEVYSPRLVTSQSDYFLSRGTRGMPSRGLSQLRSLGVQEQAIEKIQKLDEPMQIVPFYAEQDGTIAQLNLKQGSYVQRGMLLAMIQDYSSVWLRVSVAEKDIGHISPETPATLTFRTLSGRTMQARVDYIYPTIDAKTRTGQVRLVIDNPDGLIRPGSYADVDFEVAAKDKIAIPSEAILRSGEGQHVVVSLGQGRFQPKTIRTGLTSGRWTEVTDGLSVGEDIVVSGQFLIDSESALRESFRKLQRLQLPLSLMNLTKNQFAMIDHMVDAALYLHEALVDGYDVDPKFLDPAISIREMMWPKFKDTRLAYVLTDSVNALKAAQAARSPSEVRAALAQLTEALQPWLTNGAPDHYKARNVSLYTDKQSQRVWFQLAGRPVNPFGDGAADVIELKSTNNGSGTGAAAAARPVPTPTTEQPPSSAGGGHSGH
jgi:membrane fusion protein, copper/silver efflux system